MKKKPITPIQQTVNRLEALAAAAQLGSYLLEQGLVRGVIIIPPADLSKPAPDPWPPNTVLN